MSCSTLQEIIVHFDPVSTNAVTDTPSISTFIKHGDKPTALAVQLLAITVFTPAVVLVEACWSKFFSFSNLRFDNISSNCSSVKSANGGEVVTMFVRGGASLVFFPCASVPAVGLGQFLAMWLRSPHLKPSQSVFEIITPRTPSLKVMLGILSFSVVVLLLTLSPGA